jgi:UDP-N-acetylmuramate--alanine ligase
MIKPDLSQPLPETLGRLHFVGIGGSGMSGIARMFHDRGHGVTGSDRADSAAVQTLRESGIPVAIGHDASHVGEAEALVVTGALWLDNPEYQEALRRGIPVLHRAQALAWLVRGQRLIAVAGAHGKSTSTGMLVTALRRLGADPSFVNGAVIHDAGTSAAWGTGELFVVEADESDGSFLLFEPAVGLITNIDTDHLDHYGSEAAIDEAFASFAAGCGERVVLSADDAGTRRLRSAGPDAPMITFGEAEDADVRLLSISKEGPVRFSLGVAGDVIEGALAVPGRHNAANAAGVAAVLVGLGYEPQSAVAALEGFAGTQRRFESHGLAAGVRLYDDYAHHPTEVIAALQTARSVAGEGRVIAVHQPHLFSRTQAMAADFAAAYENGADHTIVLDVFGAREDPIPGVTGALVSEAFRDAERVDFLPDWAEAAVHVAHIARPGDIVMTLSCGDVYRIIPQLRDAIENTTKGGAAPEESPR